MCNVTMAVLLVGTEAALWGGGPFTEHGTTGAEGANHYYIFHGTMASHS